ncbi:MAG: L,D-transpeptidase [Verrucomicrobia bacterium]|nr:L,D-transpeptidase [Verrucomicrobiota bacterium]
MPVDWRTPESRGVSSARRSSHLSRSFRVACRKQGVRPRRFVLVASVRKQILLLLERVPGRGGVGTFPQYRIRNRYRISSSRFGIGQQEGSNQTPLGLHRIAEKIGGGRPIGTVFRSRQPAGLTWQGHPGAAITHRILWLEGLEPGFNRGGNVDTHARYIYIHGTGDEMTLGRPASKGCLHLSSADLLPLFDSIPNGTLVWIEE